LRLTVFVDRRQARVHRLDGMGREVRDASLDPDVRERGRGLYEQIVARRGGMEPAPAVDAVALPSAEVFEQLRELGYVE
jgi:hypothetical protein